MTTTDLIPADENILDASVAASPSPSTLGTIDSTGDVEHELNEMDASADALRSEGLLSPADHEQRKAEVERTRKLFRELQPEQRQAIIRRRRELGLQILDRELAGAAVVSVALKLNHTRLRPLFEQWWPYMNRMSLNLQRFGQSTFTRTELSTLETFLERELAKLEDYVDEHFVRREDRAPGRYRHPVE